MARESIPYSYKILFLTKEESANGNNLGLKFLMKNKSRWVDIEDASYELQTWDRGTSVVVYQGKVYTVYKDFIFLETAERVFIGITHDAEVDKYYPNEKEPDVNNQTIIGKGKYDYLLERDNEESEETEDEETDSEQKVTETEEVSKEEVEPESSEPETKEETE